MANNKKKTPSTRRDKKQQEEKPEAAQAGPDDVMGEKKPEWFSNSQLASIIYLTFALSKILELNAAVKQGIAEPKLCMAYLQSEETCKSELFSHLIRTKFYSSIQVGGLVLSLCYNVWNQEFYFRKLITLLCMTPLASTLITCGLNWEYLDPVKGRTLMMIVTILLLVAIPNSKSMIPFTSSDRPVNLQSLPGMCLVMLASFPLLEVGQVWSRSGTVGLENALLLAPDDAIFPEPAKVMVSFWLVDKLTMAFLFAFAFRELPESGQKVRMYVCLRIYYFAFCSQVRCPSHPMSFSLHIP